MKLPLFKVIVLTLFILLGPFRVCAQEAPHANPASKLPTSEELKKANEAFNQAKESLTPEQLAILEELDKQLAASMDPDVLILKTGADLELCLQSDPEIDTPG